MAGTQRTPGQMVASLMIADPSQAAQSSIVDRSPSTHSTVRYVRDIACMSVAKTILLLTSANRSFRHFHVYTFWQHTTNTFLSSYTMAPSATVYPAAFGHNSISNRLIDTKFEETLVYEAFDDLVQYGRHREFDDNVFRRLP